LAGTAANATSLDFNFSFTNVAEGGEDVFGIIRGLSDVATSQQASSVEILTTTGGETADGYGVGEYIGNAFRNSFVVVGGQITSADFGSSCFFSCPGGILTPSIAFQYFVGEFGTSSVAVLTGGGAPMFSLERTLITFTAVSAVQPSPIPLPAGGLLLLTGLAGIAALRRRITRGEHV